MPIVPVFFFKNLSGEGFLSPLRCPKVLVLPYWVWACRPRSNSPPRLEILNRRIITPGLDVVLLPKVDPVGGTFGGYLDL